MMAAPVRWRAIGTGRSTALALLPSVLLILGPLTVILAGNELPRPEVQTAGLVVAALPLVTPLLLRLMGQRWDPLLLSPAWVLCALSLTVIARVQPDLLAVQMLWITLGWSVFIAICGFPPLLAWLRRYRYVWLAIALLLTLATLAFGEDVTGQGARLWLQAGPITIQPAEVLRIALIVFLASYLAERGQLLAATWMRFGPINLPPPLHWAPLVGILGLTILVVLAQRDFGPSLIFVASFLGMLYVAVGRKDQIAVLVLAFAMGGAASVLASTRLQIRLGAWTDPWADPQGVGYQSLQAIGGFVFGGVMGAGPGYGYPGLIPAAHTDYPLAVVGEEWGLIGGLAVVLLYALLVTRGIARARGTSDRFLQLLSAGLALSLGAQALIVLAGVLRLLPLTGITSPFLSYGGSSMVSAWIILALMLRAGGEQNREVAAERVYLSAMIRRTRHVGVGLLAGFVVLAGTLGYWQVVRAGDLAADPAVSGQRLRLEAARITRGSLLDRNGEVLAETIAGADGRPERVYTEPSAVHLVGFDSPLLGAAGAEAAAADALMGRTQLTPLDTLRDLLREPRAGADVRLTIDLRLQRIAAEALGGGAGAVVAIDPRNGDILAMVSSPTYPANFSEEQWAAMLVDPASPLLNRATQGLYTPGSTYKTVTLIAAVEQGLVRADTPVTCPGEIFVEGIRIVNRNEPAAGPGTQNVSDAFAYSCNTVFAQMGVDLGDDRLIAASQALGLTDEVPLPLPTSRGQLANTREFLAQDGWLAATAFGQGELQLTPLHLALVTAAIGNGGQVPMPRIFLDDGTETWKTGMSPQTAQEVAIMMEHGVDAGWGSTAAIPGIRVGAKTGSAEVEEGTDSHALFIALAPMEAPTIAVAVVKERAGSGSQQAAPIARAMIEAWVGNGWDRE